MRVLDGVFAYAAEKYGIQPEYPWVRYPEYAALRHRDNQKMFALMGHIEKSRLGLPGTESVDILNVKLNDPLLVDLLLQQVGYLRAYHIRSGNWITVLLDGTVPLQDICRWLDVSFLATASSATKKNLRPAKEWIIPANPKYYASSAPSGPMMKSSGSRERASKKATRCSCMSPPLYPLSSTSVWSRKQTSPPISRKRKCQSKA